MATMSETRKNLVTARVTVKGLRPLLWHAFSPAALGGGREEKGGTAGNDPTEWTKTVLVTDDWQLYLPSTYAFGCVRDAARHTKKGKGSIQALVAATLQVTDDRILIDRYLPDGFSTLPTDPKNLVYLYVCGVKNPATKARNVRYRVAASPGWTATFHLFWDVTIVSRAQMQAVLMDAGALVGLGDGRSVGFGRFEVVNFEVLE